MKKSIRILFYINVILIVSLMSIYAWNHKPEILRGLGVEQIHASYINENAEDFDLLLQVMQIVKRHYVEELDSEEEAQKMVYGSIKGMLRSLGDQYTRFMDPEAYTNMTIETKGKFGGVGITIGIRNEQLTVISPLEDTPAFKAGLKAGDIIIDIDGVSTEDMALDDAVARIRGNPGDKVVLKIWRRGFESEGKDFEIIRDIIELKPINKSRMIDDEIGYVKLETFSQVSATELADHIKEFKSKGMKGFILDLRYNPGGLLPAAIDVARLFIDEGPIVHRQGRDGKTVTYYAKRGKKIVDVPTVVLVNKYSASASEIVSGALQDHGVATLIGETTFGKGLVQTVFRLDDDSAVLVTTDKYLTAMKRDINKLGIEPDIIVTQDSVDVHEGNKNKDDDHKPGTVGKFVVEELEGNNGVIFNKMPLKDIRYQTIDNKRYLAVDDVSKLFGATMKLDEKTGILDIETEYGDELENDENDVQLNKAIEFLKEKISESK